MNSYRNTLPEIKSLHFIGEKLELFLMDGRIISTPLSKFPEIKKLSASQRKKYHIMGGLGFDFDDSDEVYHITEFIGENTSLHPAEGKSKTYTKYKKTRSFLAAEGTTLYRKVRKPYINKP